MRSRLEVTLAPLEPDTILGAGPGHCDRCRGPQHSDIGGPRNITEYFRGSLTFVDSAKLLTGGIFYIMIIIIIIFILHRYVLVFLARKLSTRS